MEITFFCADVSSIDWYDPTVIYKPAHWIRISVHSSPHWPSAQTTQHCAGDPHLLMRWTKGRLARNERVKAERYEENQKKDTRRILRIGCTSECNAVNQELFLKKPELSCQWGTNIEVHKLLGFLQSRNEPEERRNSDVRSFKDIYFDTNNYFWDARVLSRCLDRNKAVCNE